jgi:hypothetical protein
MTKWAWGNFFFNKKTKLILGKFYFGDQHKNKSLYSHSGQFKEKYSINSVFWKSFLKISMIILGYFREWNYTNCPMIKLKIGFS